MCVKIWSDNALGEGWCFAAVGSATALLIDQVAEFRNPVEGAETAKAETETEEGEEKNPSQAQMGMRKVAAELSFLLLAVASVVENVVRTALALIALIPSAVIALYDGGETFISVGKHCSAYFFGIFDQPLRCLVALVKNVTQERFGYEDLEVCRLFDFDDC
jgi:hypothetical protein